MKQYAITVTARKKAELLPLDEPVEVAPGEVFGRTIVTLISPGTELEWNFLGNQRDPAKAFPSRPGYSAIFLVEKAGAEVRGLKAGDIAFCMGNHQSFQMHEAQQVVPVPKGLPPRAAVLARLMGVTMTTLMTTSARPGDIVIVTGAGPVGYLGAHMFSHSGYDVRVVEPDERRREIAKKSGIRLVYPEMPLSDEGVKNRVALVLECSGHEKAVLDGARVVREGGEVVLVGVPWRRKTEILAHELLHEVFHRYAVIRSGWEWELPRWSEPFRPHSIFSGFHLALKWLAEKRIPLDGLIAMHDPSEAQSLYESLLLGKTGGLFQMFDWETRK